MRKTLFWNPRTLAFMLAALFAPVLVFAQSAPTAPAPDQAGTVRRLSMDDAVQLALEHNLDLQVERLNPELQTLNTAQLRTAWTPTFNSTITNTSSSSPVTSALSGAIDTLTNKGFEAAFGVSQLLPWGADYSVSWDNTRTKNNSIYSSPNPSLGSALSLSYTQPLLKNFRIDGTRQQLLISQKNREMTDIQLRQAVFVTTRSVKSAYWDLAYAIGNLKVQQQSLDIARQSLQDNKSRVNIGTMAPIDIIEAQAEVARNEESVIVAEAAITKAEDVLRQLILDPKSPEFWTTKFDLTEQPAFRVEAVNVEGAVKKALAERTDLQQQRKSLEATDVNIRYFRNQLLPALNVEAGYGLTGQGGTTWDYDQTTWPFVLRNTTKRNYQSVLSQMLGNDYHNWSVGVTLSYPLGRSSAEAGLARARVSRSQSELQMQNTEMSVAYQVREIARQLNTNRKRVDATRASRELAEKKLEAEQKKFAAGMSTNFQVIQAQRDLASARNSELQALLDYNRSQVDFETVQQAPLGGGSSGLATASSTGGNSGSSNQ